MLRKMITEPIRRMILTVSVICTAQFVIADQTVREVQKTLNRMGFNAGVEDGILGSNTKGALVEFYRSKGMSFDGVLDSNEIIDLNITSTNFPPIGYETYSKLPCKFGAAKVGSSGYPRQKVDKTYGKKIDRCAGYRKVPRFYPKDGTSIRVSYGTPINAVSDLELVKAHDFGAQYKCVDQLWRDGQKNNKKFEEQFNLEVKDPWSKTRLRHCIKGYDGIELIFRTMDGKFLIRYYHLSSTPLVPGFGKGKCELPLMKDRTNFHDRLAISCGGVKTKYVQKGDIIGYSGTVGKGEHFGLGVKSTGEYNNNRLDKRWLIAPEDHTRWENKAFDSSLFLLPIN
jgi:hypothetical protein